MSARRSPDAEVGTQPAAAEPMPPPLAMSRWTTDLPARESPSPAASSQADADARYVVARDAWTAAMSRASSGRSADMASLAIAQEAYEEAAAERTRWEAGGQAAIPVEPQPDRTNIDVIVGQELAWRQLHERDGRSPSMLGRLARRITRRS